MRIAAPGTVARGNYRPGAGMPGAPLRALSTWHSFPGATGPKHP